MPSHSYDLDPYVIDVLMRDLVGHDRRPSAFLVYLTLAAGEPAGGRRAMRYAHLAQQTGLSKRAVQSAIALLSRRGLLRVTREGPTDTPVYEALSPWRRQDP